MFYSCNTKVQYHDVRVTVQMNSWNNCVNWIGNTAPPAQPLSNCQLLIDYVYLDSEERKRFAQASHEYLIEQLQFTGSESITSVTNKYRLNFNHPSKYLIWVPHLNQYNSRNVWAVHALAQGSWAAAYDRMAKIAAMASANARVSNNQILVDIAAASQPTANGLSALKGNVVFKSLLDSILPSTGKVTVLCKTYSSPAQPVTGVYVGCVIGQAANAADAWVDAFNNCVVTDNNLHANDLSYTVSQLLGSTTEACGVLTDANMVATQVNVLDQFNYGNFVDGTDNPCVNAKLQLNGHDRFQILDGYYFNYVQPYQHFDNTPADGVNVYSFALKAQDHQPTGTCNFSRIDNATLQVDLGVANSYATESALGYSGVNANTVYQQNLLGANSSLLNIYTVNYNVLRVMSEKNLLALMIYYIINQILLIKFINALKSSTLIQITYKNKEKSLVECYQTKIV